MSPSQNSVTIAQTREQVVEQTHGVLAALLHCSVASDLSSNPEGWLRARGLGLIEGTRATPLGRGVLRALGLDMGSR